MSVLATVLDQAPDSFANNDDYKRWMSEMLSGEDDQENETVLDAEDADWNENIFLEEEEEGEYQIHSSLYLAGVTVSPVGEEEDQDQVPFSPQEEEEEAPAQVSSPSADTTPNKPRDARKCREWARENQMSVGTRGVISAEIWDAYLAS